MSNDSSKLTVQIIITKLILPRMEELDITPYRLSKLTGIDRSTLSRFFNNTEYEIPLTKFLTILGQLDIRPQFVTGEDDNLEYNYIHLN